MLRDSLDKYICETYGTKADFPWESTPSNAVYRHKDSRKWFLLMMELPMSKFLPKAKESVTVINLKCDPLLIGSIVDHTEIFPAYHMNKGHWISVIIDHISDEEKVKWLIEISYNLTKK